MNDPLTTLRFAQEAGVERVNEECVAEGRGLLCSFPTKGTKSTKRER